ncbi:MAG: hypothetical protein H7X76_08780 [Prolixibacteraceae bacterium]|nr:hypothetical protein [Burkholderiales bacterium]
MERESFAWGAAALSVMGAVALVFAGKMGIGPAIGLLAGGCFILIRLWGKPIVRVLSAIGDSPKLSEFICVGTLVLVTLLMLGPVARGDPPFSVDHPVHYFQAWQFKERFWADGWFFWSNLWYAGYPVSYSYPVGAYLWISLVDWLTLDKLAFSNVYAVGFWLFYLFHGYSVYFLGKAAFNRKIGLIAALFYLMDRGAIFSGGWFWLVAVGTWPIALSVAFSTMATVYLARVLERGRRTDVGACAAFLGLALLTHPLQLMHIPVLFATAFVIACFVLPSALLRRTVPWAVLAGGLGLLIGAGWYLPFIETSEFTRAYGHAGISIIEVGANLYKASLMPSSAGFLPEVDTIPSGAAEFIPSSLDGVAIYVSVLSVLSVPILLASRKLLPILFCVLTMLILIATSSSTHYALHLAEWWPRYQHVEFPRFMMLIKPCICIAAAAGLLGLWRGLKTHGMGGWNFSSVPAGKGYFATVVLGTLIATLAWPSAVVVLNRNVFQPVALRSRIETVSEQEKLAKWIRDIKSRDERFFRLAARSTHQDGHELFSLGVDLPVPIYHLGFTPACSYLYSMSVDSEAFFPPAADSNEIFRALNVRYLVSTSRIERADLMPVNAFGSLLVYEFTDWNPDPFVVLEGQSKIDMQRFEPQEIVFAALPGANGRLRLNISFFPRWSATKDGKEIPIGTTSVGNDTAFMTVPLSPGLYRFTFGRGWSEWLALLSLVLGAFASAFLMLGWSKSGVVLT